MTQEPVAWMRIDGMKAMPALEKEAWLSTGRKFDKEIVEDYTIPLYTTPPQRTEQNFCSRCGKRVGGIDSIHTCTPPMEKNT